MKEQLALLSPHRAFWLWFGGIWLVVGAVFLPVGIWVGLQEQRFEREGVRVTAIVLTKGFDRADEDNESTDYWITYRFTTADGQVATGRAGVSAEQWDALAERGPVEVQYLPAEPSNNRLSRGRDWVLPILFVSLSAIFAPAGGVLFVKGVRDVRRMRALFLEGVAAEGTIVRIEDAHHTVNDVPQRRLVYHYVDDLGQHHEGSSEPLPPDEAATWSVGDRGRVHYRRGWPEQSIWVGRGRGHGHGQRERSSAAKPEGD